VCLAQTHAVGGILAALLAQFLQQKYHIFGLNHYTTFEGIASVVFGSQIPDIDTARSLISSMFPPVSWVSRLFVTHRGFTHLILPMLLIWGWYYTKEFYLMGFAIGIISHTLLDIFTKFVGITCDSAGEDIIYWGGYAVLVYLIWLRYNVPIMYVLNNVSDAFMYAYSTGNEAVAYVKK
jgi:hypothetical protein